MNSKYDDLRPEYSADLIKKGERGKYAKRFRGGTNVVLIEPELHELFPDSEPVNRALREYVAQKQRAAT